MTIKLNSVVSLFYRLKDENEHLLEDNFDSTPMVYLHGHKNIFSDLESELEGLGIGDEKQVSLAPNQAYGERRDNAAKKVPVKHLLGKPKKLRPGQLVKVNTEKGAVDAQVIKAGKFMVELDFNHPLAGLSLIFDIKIGDIREASAEEIAHGHAHGIGGHQH